MLKQSDEDLMLRGKQLAGDASGAGVLENQLARVAAHLKRHRNLQQTLGMLDALIKSPFANRNRGTRSQYKVLSRLVRGAVVGADWEQAAQIVGWARRLLTAERVGAAGGARTSPDRK